MNQDDARQQFIEGPDRYVSGIETDDRLQRLATNVRDYHDRMPSEAAIGERDRVADETFHEQLRWSVRGSVAALQRSRSRTGRDRR